MKYIARAAGFSFGYIKPPPRPIRPADPPVDPATLPPKPLMPAPGQEWGESDLRKTINREDRGDFTLVGWSYERSPSVTLVCIECGGHHFIVGQNGDALITVIKCPTCGWERCIHDG